MYLTQTVSFYDLWKIPSEQKTIHLIFFYTNIFNNLPFLWVQDYSPGMEGGVVNYSSSIAILFQLHYVDGVESLVSPIEVAPHPVDSHPFHIAYSSVHHSLPL